MAAMSCYGCLCHSCARNCEQDMKYFTPGEFQGDACFNCDDCAEYTGHWTHHARKPECEEYIEARKYSEFRARQMRKKWRVLRG